MKPDLRPRIQSSLGAAIVWALWLYSGRTHFLVLALIASSFAVLAWIAPRLFAPVQRIIDFILHCILTGTTWFLLGLVYFGIFTPIRVWRALTGKDPLRLRPAPGTVSYLEPLPPARPGHFERQF